jgi:hypothetical protein
MSSVAKYHEVIFAKGKKDVYTPTATSVPEMRQKK